MRWFKHDSDSLSDPFVFDLMTGYGAQGYLVWFGLLEAYSREFKPEKDWIFESSLLFLRSKFRLSRSVLLVNILHSINDSQKAHVEIEGDRVRIHIPKFHKRIDEYTEKLVRRNLKNVGTKSGQCRDFVALEGEEEVDLEVEKDKEEEKGGSDKSAPPKSHPKSFEQFLSEILKSPAYQHIDIPREIEKIRVWLLKPQNKGKKLTPSRVLNWLNKIEPNEGGGNGTGQGDDRPPTDPVERKAWESIRRLKGLEVSDKAPEKSPTPAC